ncbi:hypothetical protein MAR_004333 [Mya arenaria]|uniref:Uncharacterized protein n=1 Tax=Mya arenaria TaxID=6604 RepID=A0ABY7F0F8_MYAAR|nr:hypothetical protein MAR_004333 [Mya arenaria]
MDIPMAGKVAGGTAKLRTQTRALSIKIDFTELLYRVEGTKDNGDVSINLWTPFCKIGHSVWTFNIEACQEGLSDVLITDDLTPLRMKLRELVKSNLDTSKVFTKDGNVHCTYKDKHVVITSPDDLFHIGMDMRAWCSSFIIPTSTPHVVKLTELWNGCSVSCVGMFQEIFYKRRATPDGKLCDTAYGYIQLI